MGRGRSPRIQKPTPLLATTQLLYYAPHIGQHLRPAGGPHNFAKIIDFLSVQRELLVGVLSLILLFEAAVRGRQT